MFISKIYQIYQFSRYVFSLEDFNFLQACYSELSNFFCYVSIHSRIVTWMIRKIKCIFLSCRCIIFFLFVILNGQLCWQTKHSWFNYILQFRSKSFIICCTSYIFMLFAVWLVFQILLINYIWKLSSSSGRYAFGDSITSIYWNWRFLCQEDWTLCRGSFMKQNQLCS